MHSQKDSFHILLQPLYDTMQLARTAYASYTGNRILERAEEIRKANRKIYRLLTSKSAYIPGELQDDIPVLLHHYDSWFQQFREHKKKHNPTLKDEFIFTRQEGQPAFPRHIEEKIFGVYEKMKTELAGKPEPSIMTNH